MQGLESVFIALSLLLSPLTIDRKGANSSASGDGAMTLTQQAEHSESGYHANGPVVSSIEGGGMSSTTTEDKDNSDCPIKYLDPNSKAYCKCIVKGTNNKCSSPCHPHMPQGLNANEVGWVMVRGELDKEHRVKQLYCPQKQIFSCRSEHRSDPAHCGSVVVVVGTCAGCVAFCVVRSRNRRDNYTLVNSSP